ncbi:ABC transporter permease [candidate division CSSED10-310 bacterium]|uniref:Transport permease protein n=1 Tax=candidate division CSSED10-310 bacterium TaxID=2855610 RepID=A0ABV6YQU7_UNCC1
MTIHNILKKIQYFFHDLREHQSLIVSLVKRDFKTRYAGSLLGLLWLFIQPLVTIIIFWFVFEIGFKLKPVENFPFILWLVCGLLPWFFFSEAIMICSTAITENPYIVKKFVFRISFLLISRIFTALLLHIFFIIVLFLMFAFYGYYPDLYCLQLPYYLGAMLLLVTGLSFFSSAAVIFFKDIGQFIQVSLQFLFWATPIFWSLNLIPVQYQTLIKLNPLFYIVTGYRECLITKGCLWQHPELSLYYWSITLATFIGGILFFKRLRPHFGDVL